MSYFEEQHGLGGPEDHSGVLPVETSTSADPELPPDSEWSGPNFKYPIPAREPGAPEDRSLRLLRHLVRLMEQEADPEKKRSIAENVFIHAVRKLEIPEGSKEFLWKLLNLTFHDAEGNRDALVDVLSSQTPVSTAEYGEDHHYIFWKRLQEVPPKEKKIYEQVLGFITDSLYVPVEGAERESHEAHITRLESFLQHYGEFEQHPIFEKWLANPKTTEKSFVFLGLNFSAQDIGLTDLRQ